LGAQRKSVFVQGVALQTSFADASSSLTDLIFKGVTAALADARTDMSEVDSVVLAAHDLVDGRSLSSMVTAPAAGAYLRDEIRLSSDGLTAASLAAARIEAGEAKLSVVAAWGRASEGDFDRLSRAAMDPFLQQPLGFGEYHISALRLNAWQHRFPSREEDRVRAAERRTARAISNPRALQGPATPSRLHYPLLAGEGPLFADIVVAFIIGKTESPVRIAGIGHSVETTEIGSRDLAALTSLRDATTAARADAGIGNDQLSFVELDGFTLSDEALAIEAIGLCNPGDGFRTYAASERVNLSGGGAAGWCYPAMGLARLAECRFRLTERDRGASELAPRYALATGASPLGGQTHSAMVLEAA
jgi:acetyl-CoA C-acetyltransferase